VCLRVGRAEFRARQGEHYWFALMGLPGTALPPGRTPAEFIFRLRPAPTNDLFASRLTLAGTNITVAGDTSWAATEPEEPTGSTGVRIVNTLWYTWTAPGNGTLRMNGVTGQTGFVFCATAFLGDVLNVLVPAPAANGATLVRYGDRLQIQVGSFYRPAEHAGGGAGAFTFNLEFRLQFQPAWCWTRVNLSSTVGSACVLCRWRNAGWRRRSSRRCRGTSTPSSCTAFPRSIPSTRPSSRSSSGSTADRL
jgi:hypothetical protein